jgi:hypothetical protein
MASIRPSMVTGSAQTYPANQSTFLMGFMMPARRGKQRAWRR